MSFGENLVFVWVCTCGERMKVLPEPDSTPNHPRYRVQHGPNPEMVSPVLEGLERSHAWREQLHAYLSNQNPASPRRGGGED